MSRDFELGRDVSCDLLRVDRQSRMGLIYFQISQQLKCCNKSPVENCVRSKFKVHVWSLFSSSGALQGNLHVVDNAQFQIIKNELKSISHNSVQINGVCKIQLMECQKGLSPS